MDIIEVQIEKKKKADKLVQFRTLFSAGAGFIPVPYLDAASILTIQIWMLRDLSKLYDVPFREHRAKSVIGTLVGNVSTVSIIKVIPGLGSVLGGGALAASAGATTYALGKIFTKHFDHGGTFLNFDPIKSREYFKKLYEEGANVVKDLQTTQGGSLSDVHARAVSSTATLKIATEELRATITALQEQLDQQAKTLHAAPEKRKNRFGFIGRFVSWSIKWTIRLIILLVLAIAGYWLYRSGYVARFFSKSHHALNATDSTAITSPVQYAETLTDKKDSSSTMAEQHTIVPPPAAPEETLAARFEPNSTESFLADYLGKTTATFPKMMPLDAVNFEPGIETLAADGQRQVKHLAAVLSAYPESRVTIFGPTDPGVDPATSRDLGMNRAKTIALILNQLGIQSGRIATDVVETGAGAPVNAQVEVMNR